jgi:hypothetical protein
VSESLHSSLRNEEASLLPSMLEKLSARWVVHRTRPSKEELGERNEQMRGDESQRR